VRAEIKIELRRKTHNLFCATIFNNNGGHKKKNTSIRSEMLPFKYNALISVRNLFSLIDYFKLNTRIKVHECVCVFNCKLKIKTVDWNTYLYSFRNQNNMVCDFSQLL